MSKSYKPALFGATLITAATTVYVHLAMHPSVPHVVHQLAIQPASLTSPLNSESNIIVSDSADLLDKFTYESARRINRVWRPPEDGDSNIVLRYLVHKNGVIKKIKDMHLSGTFNCQKAAEEAISEASPFSPLPEPIPDELTIEVDFNNAHPRTSLPTVRAILTQTKGISNELITCYDKRQKLRAIASELRKTAKFKNQQSKHVEALVLLEQADLLDPRNTAIRTDIAITGETYYDNSPRIKHKTALEALHKAIWYAPSDHCPLNKLASAMSQTGKNPDSAEDRETFGTECWDKGDLFGAIIAYRKSKEILSGQVKTQPILRAKLAVDTLANQAIIALDKKRETSKKRLLCSLKKQL